MKQQQLTLAPGQSRVVQFQIAVPASAYPGQHMGGISADNLTPQSPSVKGAFRITILSRTIMAVQVNVPGATVEKMAVTGVKAGGSNGYQNLLVSMANTGSMMVSPDGNMQISDTQGHLLQTLPLKSGIILPDTKIDYPVNVQKKALTPGDYPISLVLHYGHGKTLTYTTNLTITQDQVNQAFSNGPLQAPTSNSSSMPLWQIILLVLAVLIVLLVGGQKVYSMVTTHRHKQEGNHDNPSVPLPKKHKILR